MGISTLGARVHVAIAAWPWGAYLGEEGLQKGIRVKTSSYTRHHVNSTMPRAKLSGTYPNSILANLEVTRQGYDEALLLDNQGFVAEGAGENLFIVKDGRIYEPEIASALTGITRDVADGDAVPLTLTFRDGQGKPVTATASVTVRGLLLPQQRPEASRDAATPAPSAPAPAPQPGMRM